MRQVLKLPPTPDAAADDLGNLSFFAYTPRMKPDVEKQRRRSIRLREYDDTQAGAYFITIVAQARAMLFGEIAGGKMRLSEFGLVVQQVWQIYRNIIQGSNATRLWSCPTR